MALASYAVDARSEPENIVHPSADFTEHRKLSDGHLAQLNNKQRKPATISRNN
jgi:hypothetical protein